MQSLFCTTMTSLVLVCVIQWGRERERTEQEHKDTQVFVCVGPAPERRSGSTAVPFLPPSPLCSLPSHPMGHWQAWIGTEADPLSLPNRATWHLKICLGTYITLSWTLTFTQMQILYAYSGFCMAKIRIIIHRSISATHYCRYECYSTSCLVLFLVRGACRHTLSHRGRR